VCTTKTFKHVVQPMRVQKRLTHATLPQKKTHATYASVIYGHIAFYNAFAYNTTWYKKCTRSAAMRTKRNGRFLYKFFDPKRPRIRLNCTLMSSSLPISLPTIFAVLCNTEDYYSAYPISKPRIKLGKLLYAAKRAEETTAQENVPRARSLLWELSRTIPIAGKHCSRQSCMRGITFC
jgi:hypothetical protein